MENFVFTSPGYKFRERDLTFVTKNVGITTAGLVGETVQGPAFEPVAIESIKDYNEIFGGISNERFNGKLKYQLGFAAKSFLAESSQLYVTRVLGLSGYDAGKSWAITVNGGIDVDTIVSGTTTSLPNYTLTGNTSYLFPYLIDDDFEGIPSVEINKVTGWETKIRNNFVRNGNVFEGKELTVTVVNFNTTDIELECTITELTAQPLEDYENMVVALIRSKGSVESVANGEDKVKWEAISVELDTNNTNGDLFGNFGLKVTYKDVDGVDVDETYIVSLNPKQNFISNVLGKSPIDNKESKIWVEAVYPELISKMYYDDLAHSINGVKEFNTFNDYVESFQTPETPWIVSELKGGGVDKLFKFISISDGNAANKQLKITIQNIDFSDNTFDIVLRNFNDTDDSPEVIGMFNKCNLDETSNNYIGKKIGTVDGFYPLKNKYIMVEIADDVDINSVPAGFEGYNMFDFGNVEKQTQIPYNTEYSDIDDNRVVRKEFLGISEKGFNKSRIDQNFFNYMGNKNLSKTKGFHLDHEALSDAFVAPENEKAEFKKDMTDNTSNPYNKLIARKFTVVPAGGFDGWNIYQNKRTIEDGYRKGGIYNNQEITKLTDYIAWENAINTFSNPEEVTINLFATPGLNWGDNTSLVKFAIEMVETRTDSLYVIDSPDSTVETTIDFKSGGKKQDVLASEQIVSSLDSADIDSNYACTYFPWIQVNSSGSYIYIPPTGEVLKSIASTDKIDYPWFAVAGLNRGVINAIAPKYNLSQDARDILYKGRINPIAQFSNVGTAIFGQKTLQIKDTALNRINVRRLLLQIKVLIANIAIRLVFEQGDQTIMEQFLTKANPVLDEIRKNRGLLDFRIKMDDDNNTPETLDRNELYGEIFLKPTRAIEYIGITFTVTPSGASFEDFGA